MAVSDVCVVPCPDYDEDRIYKAVRYGVDTLGGIRSFVNPTQKILVKPNFLSPADPDSAVTTHPAVTGAVFRLLSEEGFCDVTYGDSPGHGTSRAAAAKSGTDTFAEKYGAKPADMGSEVKAAFPEGRYARSFFLCRGVYDADAVINVCKMKTHQLMKITGAVKNVYGYICGARKAAGHVSFPNAEAFARMLCDIHRFKPPALNIMDAVTAMEGNGPGSGTPRHMGLILLSRDPVAIDSIFSRLVCLDPRLVPTCLQGELAGIGNLDPGRIRILLCDTAGYACPREVSMDELVTLYGEPGFDVDREGQRLRFLGRLSVISSRFAKRPRIDPALCIRCGICVSHCPVPGKALHFKDSAHSSPPVYDYRRCIRCYCCQEMCPRKAVRC